MFSREDDVSPPRLSIRTAEIGTTLMQHPVVWRLAAVVGIPIRAYRIRQGWVVLSAGFSPPTTTRWRARSGGCKVQLAAHEYTSRETRTISSFNHGRPQGHIIHLAERECSSSAASEIREENPLAESRTKPPNLRKEMGKAAIRMRTRPIQNAAPWNLVPNHGRFKFPKSTSAFQRCTPSNRRSHRIDL